MFSYNAAILKTGWVGAGRVIGELLIKIMKKVLNNENAFMSVDFAGNYERHCGVIIRTQHCVYSNK